MRGQVATEYIMTYGWAVLVVLVAVGALAYFGVTSPSGLIPEKCVLTTGFNCAEFRLEQDDGTNGNEVLFRIINNRGVDVTLYQVNMTCVRGCEGTTPTGSEALCGLFSEGGMGLPPITASTTVRNGQSVWVICNRNNQASIVFSGVGTGARIDLEFEYSNSGSSVRHQASGQILAPVQER